MFRHPPRSPLFPTPTLSRSLHAAAHIHEAAFARRVGGQLVDHPVRQVVGERAQPLLAFAQRVGPALDLRSEDTRLNSSHANISYAVFCLKKKNYTESLFLHS